MEPIASSYVYDFPLHRRVIALNLRSHPKLRWKLRAWLSIFPVLCGVCLLAASLLHAARDREGVIEFLSIAGFMALCTVYAFWIIQHRRKRTFRQRGPRKASTETQTITLTEAGIVSDIRNVARTDVAWAAFCEFAMDDEIALLYASPVDFFVMPRAGMEPGQWERLRPLLSEKIGASKC